ncbi:archaemetzincin [Flavobacterium sp.]|uniref:archaemetzincin n=1 Tax=Flavobacterium sp. TaxID=239 RepID=UPI00261F56FF|nr:archaemetzincin [Flavobacterium sp.]
MPSSALSFKKSTRYQAQKLIKFQLENCPDTLDYILGLTTKDICVTKRDKRGRILKPEWKYTDFGIMGLGYRPGKSAIVSTFRLKHSNPNLVLDRAKKVAIHEFGHNLGIPHCPNSHCVMTAAKEKISTIDNESLFLCTDCKRLMQLNVKA